MRKNSKKICGWGRGAAAGLALALLGVPALAATVDGECDYVSDEAYRKLDPQEISCVFTWIHDKSVPAEGRCVRLSVEKYSESGAIMLALKNHCPHAIIFHEALLPWNASSGFDMEVVSPRSPEHPMRANHPPSFSMKYVVLGPERSIRAIFPLDSRFPGFSRALQRRDLMLYWGFQFAPGTPVQEGGILFRALRPFRAAQDARASAGQGETAAQPANEEPAEATTDEAVDGRDAGPADERGEGGQAGR